MIDQAHIENVFFSTAGAGFKRKALWRCRVGPHTLFKLLGTVAVLYSSGAQRWLIVRGYIPEDNARDEVVGRYTSYPHAAAAAAIYVNEIYSKESARESSPA